MSFRIFSDSIIDLSNETITFINYHAMYILYIDSQSELSAMYILAAL